MNGGQIPLLLKGLIRKNSGEPAKWVIECCYCNNLEPKNERIMSNQVEFSPIDLDYEWSMTKPISYSNVDQGFYLMFHIYEPTSTVKIRLLSIYVNYDDLQSTWVKEEIDEISPIRRNLIVDRLEHGGCEIKIKYINRKLPILIGEPAIFILNIEKIGIGFNSIEKISDLTNLNGDRITLRIGTDNYLGRPNEINTHGTSRIYTWKSNLNNQGHEFNPFKVEKENDLKELRQMDNDLIIDSPRKIKTLTQLMSPRKKGIKRPSVIRQHYVPDNDDINNPIQMPEIHIYLNQEIVLTSFNFKYTPVRALRYTIYFNELIDHYLKVVDKKGSEIKRKKRGSRKGSMIITKTIISNRRNFEELTMGSENMPKVSIRIEKDNDIIDISLKASETSSFIVDSVSITFKDHLNRFSNKV